MNIIVLCGGLSMERDVSITSSLKIAEALRSKGHRAVLVDSFFGYTGEYSDPKEIFEKPFNDSIHTISGDVPDLDAVKKSRSQSNASRVGDNLFEICRAADIVFMGMHGADGEDGKLQAAFDLEGIKYTGTGPLGSAVAMDKGVAKAILAQNGIPVPQGRVIRRGDADKSAPCFPCFVKPNSSGSSVGASIVYAPGEYESALDTAFCYDDAVVVEEYIKGREVDVGVLDGRALPPIEIRPKSGWFDYKNKYQDGMTDEICPAPFPAETDRLLRETAEKVFSALKLEVYSRMDFIVMEDGSLRCLEANTLPGMTPASLLPKEAAAAGISYPDLCETILRLSLERYE